MYLFWLLFFSLVQEDGTFRLPRNEMGEECPFPFDPPQLVGRPIGMYHCPYCGGMVMAGMRHPDYTGV